MVFVIMHANSRTNVCFIKMEWNVGPQKRGRWKVGPKTARDERFGANQLGIDPKTVGDGKLVLKEGKMGGWP